MRRCTCSRLLQSFGNFQQPLFFFGNFASIAGFNRAGQQEELFDMGKKCLVVALAMFAFGFGTALRSNAGTDMVEPYQAPARSYNYAPPPRPRPVAFLPPVRIGVFFGPGFGYYGPGYGYHGRGYGYGGHRYYGRRGYGRGPGHHWH